MPRGFMPDVTDTVLACVRYNIAISFAADIAPRPTTVMIFCVFAFEKRFI